MINSSDSLRLTGLDTLSERALRRMVGPWTGELRTPDSVGTIEREGVVESSTFDNIVEGWRRGREIYTDSDVTSVMGEGSSLSDGLTLLRDSSVEVADSVALGADAMVSGMADSLMVGELPSKTRIAEQLLHGMSDMAREASQWSDMLLNLLMAGVVVGYMYCIYRYYEDVVALISSVFSKSVISANRVGERRRSDIFYGFLGKIFILGVAFVGLFAMLFLMSGGSESLLLTQSVILSSPLIAVMVFALLILFQYAELFVVGVVTRSLSDIVSIMRLRLTYFVFFTVVASPLLLVSMVGHGQAYEVWSSLALAASLMTLLFYLRESLQFFISKKISILHWFLYLCTVEILPLSLLWQLVVRL